MSSHYHLDLTCVCGHHRHLRADDIPVAWLDAPGLNIHGWVLDRMVCLACGRRGRPQSTIRTPVKTGGDGDGRTLYQIAAQSQG